jgi:hypothetical protein
MERTHLYGADLKVEIRKLDGRKLSVSYKLRNGSGGAILVFNRLYSSDSMGNIEMRPERFYIYPDGPDSLALSRRFIPVPGGMAVEDPEVPLGVILKNGQELSETVIMALPLQMDIPYGGGKDLKTGIFRKINFSLGVVPMREDLETARRRLEGEDVLTLRYGQALKNQIVLSAEPAACEVEALVGHSSH